MSFGRLDPPSGRACRMKTYGGYVIYKGDPGSPPVLPYFSLTMPVADK